MVFSPTRLNLYAAGLLLLLFVTVCRAGDLTLVSTGAIDHTEDPDGAAPIYIDKSEIGRVIKNSDVSLCSGYYVPIPQQWHPGLTMEIRWGVSYSVSYPQKVWPPFNYFQAQVPIPEYTHPGCLVVHFFPDNKVLITISEAGDASNAVHAIRDDDPHAMDSATPGHPVPQPVTEEKELPRLFSDEEQHQVDDAYKLRSDLYRRLLK
jgi:hypothetical protein